MSRKRSDSVASVAATDDLTICSVTYGDGPVLAVNRRLSERLNPGGLPRWLVVRNRPEQPADDALESDPGFDVVPGAEMGEHIDGQGPRSVHHALGMNLVPAHVSTRFVMYLDPDCFVLRPNWVEEVIAHMLERSLTTFGVPYHPRAAQKIRYIPCGVGMVVDTDRLSLEGVDWRPRTDVGADRMSFCDRLVDTALRRADSQHRLRIEASLDTGIDFYRRHRDQNLATECVQPVMLPMHLRSRLKHPRERVFEAILPDHFCLLPRRPGYFTDRGFAFHGHRDLANEGCEEYLWRDAPFAVHLRGGPPALREDLDELEGVLHDLTS
jgi:hypothetical protein